MTNKLAKAFALFDKANSADPNTVLWEGKYIAKELLYAQRMSQRLQTFSPHASEPLQLAARAQHIERWKSPRSAYAEGRTGYKKWRADLGLLHANRAAEIMAQVGYEQHVIDRVKFLLQKRQLRRDPETQTLEDVICLVFIEFYLADFADKHQEEKLLDIIAKTWKKMSVAGQKAAIELPIAPRLAVMLTKAIGSADPTL